MTHAAPPLPTELDDEAGLDLFALARCIRFDRRSGNLIIRNGEAAIVLQPDGTVRIDAKRIVQVADEGFVVSAATIDLN